MNQHSKIYIPGNSGLVGSSIVRRLQAEGYDNLVFTPYPEYDLRNQQQVMDFFAKEKPDYVFLAAAKVGGIMANNTYPAEFIYDNLMIEANIIHASYVHNVIKLLFLGSSCIYPKDAPQPLKEEYLLTGLLESTNEPYAIAKIAGIKMCDSYARQYGCNFISAMPTNLYGPNDNYDLEKSHVLPALIRKMHLGKCLENGDWQGIRKDLERRPVGGVTPNSTEFEILEILKRYGINYELRKTKDINPVSGIWHPAAPPPTPSPFGAGELDSPSGIPAWPAGRRQPVSLTLWGTGNVYREFLHVNDLADALVFMMQNFDTPLASSPANTVTRHSSPVTFLNIGTGQDTTIREIAYLVKDIIGFSGELLWDSTKPDGTYKKQLDVSLLRSLGWSEQITLRAGISSVYEEYLLY